jgi:hypothetical protein
MSDHDFNFEPQPGLPKPLPEGETLLWQGSPDPAALAHEAFKAHWVLGYLLIIAVWRASVAFEGGFGQSVAVFLPYLVLALAAYGLVRLLARASAKAAIYSITTRRVILRIGAALQVTWTVPFTRVASAGLSTRPVSGTGTIALDLTEGKRISYLALWPHLRPGFAWKVQPAFRCIPDAARVARILSDAAQTSVNEPVVRFINPSPIAAE